MDIVIDSRTKHHLIDYVTSFTLNREINTSIRLFCEEQNPISTKVYRGQEKEREIKPCAWFSTSRDRKIAENGFTDKKSPILFIIHLQKVPAIDVNEYVHDDIHGYTDEKEMIILGGGFFYKDAGQKEVGFMSKEGGVFECWYSFEPPIDPVPSAQSAPFINEPKAFDLQQAIESILPEEYEMIDGPEDIIIPGMSLTVDQKRQVFDEIQQRLHPVYMNQHILPAFTPELHNFIQRWSEIIKNEEEGMEEKDMNEDAEN